MATIEEVEYRLAQTLLDCLCVALSDNQVADPTLPRPARCCLRGGADLVLDIDEAGNDACCDGEAYVRVTDVSPASTFGTPDEPGIMPCQMQRLDVTLELGVIRCLPLSPTCEEGTFSVRQLAADRAAAMTAACCWGKLIQDPKISGRGTKWFAGGWSTFGPDANCVGGTMTLMASVAGPGCC